MNDYLMKNKENKLINHKKYQTVNNILFRK
jgi:hypothetical protein